MNSMLHAFRRHLCLVVVFCLFPATPPLRAQKPAARKRRLLVMQLQTQAGPGKSARAGRSWFITSPRSTNGRTIAS